jgi:hypothetical protein
MRRVALPGGLPAVTTANAGAQPSGSFPISGRGFQLTLVGQFTPTAFTTQRGLILRDGTLAGTVTRPSGQTQTMTGLAGRLPLRSVQATCQPATVTIVTAPTTALVSAPSRRSTIWSSLRA